MKLKMRKLEAWHKYVLAVWVVCFIVLASMAAVHANNRTRAASLVDQNTKYTVALAGCEMGVTHGQHR